MSKLIKRDQIAHNLVHSSPIKNQYQSDTLYPNNNESSSSIHPSTADNNENENGIIAISKLNNPFVDSTINSNLPYLQQQQSSIEIINENSIPRVLSDFKFRHSTPLKFEQDLIITSPNHRRILHPTPPLSRSIKSEQQAPSIRCSPRISQQQQLEIINKNLSMELVVDKDFLTSEYENQDEVAKRHEVYRNIYDTSPSQSSRILKSHILHSRSSLINEMSINSANEIEDSMSQLALRKQQLYQNAPIKQSPMALKRMAATPSTITTSSIGGRSVSSRNSNSSIYELPNLSKIEKPKSKGRGRPRIHFPDPSVPKIKKKPGPKPKVKVKPEFDFFVTLKISPERLTGFGRRKRRRLTNKKAPTPESSSSSSPIETSSTSSKERATRNSKKKILIDPHDHKKKLGARSKTGCWTCRIRHKACPEEKPICSQCERLGLKCDYSNERPRYMRDKNLQQAKLKEIRSITNQSKRVNFIKRRKGSGLLTNDESLKYESTTSDSNKSVPKKKSRK
ncbi:unnamed protein product [Candida verbasci]|uniref:Zn(2)-C6 fungal-type domain-containing protein n=1 Tax=Candida verbasci TaxID=1227364 RepID=A0A9W4TXX8_9ASCO|nr:unnamed protein product [Candida verbasci]